MNNLEIGKAGENMAFDYIHKKGYRILERNYGIPSVGEIDIIGRAPNGVLVFFEVKTLKVIKEDSLIPEDNLTNSKLAKLRRACTLFSAKHPELIDDNKGWQIDLIAITMKGDDLTNIKDSCIISHYENI